MGKWAADAREHGVCDSGDVDAPPERLEGRERGSFVLRCQTAGRSSAHNRPGRFCEGER